GPHSAHRLSPPGERPRRGLEFPLPSRTSKGAPAEDELHVEATGDILLWRVLRGGSLRLARSASGGARDGPGFRGALLLAHVPASRCGASKPRFSGVRGISHSVA